MKIFYYKYNSVTKLGLGVKDKFISFDELKKILPKKYTAKDSPVTQPELFRYCEDIITPFYELERVISEKGIYNLNEIDVEKSIFLPPSISPSKIICLGLNYSDHAREVGRPIPVKPNLFSKAPSALIAHKEAINLPKISQAVDYEAELAIIIGKKCKDVPASRAKDFILGYTIINDVTARDLEFEENAQWFRSKSLDTFAPLGPFILTNSYNLNPDNLRIRLWVNGELRQDSNTSKMVYNCYEIVSFVSSDLTLLPGDIIATGTPSGIGMRQIPEPKYLKTGDTVKIEVERIGSLENTVN